MPALVRSDRGIMQDCYIRRSLLAGGQAQHGSAAFHRRLYPMGVADVARKDYEMPLHIGRAVVGPAPGSKGVVRHKRAHNVALAHQCLGQVRADETVCAGD